MTRYVPPLRWTAAALTVLSLTGLTTAAVAAAPAPPTASSSSSHSPDLDAAPDVIATDIQMPWGLAFLPGGDVLITERQTRRVLRIGPGHEPELVRTIPDVYIPGGDGGLLGLDLSPRFARDELVYVYYTAVGGESRIARFKLGSDEPLEVVLAFTRGDNHSGGRLKFGPDGMLYATVGDGRNPANAQDLTNLNGKILRVTPNGRPAPGNPFPHSPIWSYGHRNPEGLAWDAQGRLYSAEFGEDALDEINLIRPTMPLSKGRIGEPKVYFPGVHGRLRTVELAPDGALWLTTSNHPRQPREGDDRILRFPTR